MPGWHPCHCVRAENVDSHDSGAASLRRLKAEARSAAEAFADTRRAELPVAGDLRPTVQHRNRLRLDAVGGGVLGHARTAAKGTESTEQVRIDSRPRVVARDVDG
jgi:hypothetical protein